MGALRTLLGAVGLGGGIQNTDERPGDRIGRPSGSVFLSGRAWVCPKAGSYPQGISFSWNLRSDHVLVAFDVESGESSVDLTWGVPPGLFHIHVPGLPKAVFKVLGVDWESLQEDPDCGFLTHREIRVAVHDWAVWWSLWMPAHMSKASDPWYRRGNLQILDVLFGRAEYERVSVAVECGVPVPMPERVYRAKVEVDRLTHRRPRWPFSFGPERLFRSGLQYTTTPDEGIPIPGKGENSFDCEDGKIYSQSGPGGVTKAVAGLVQSALKTRKQRSGHYGWGAHRSGARPIGGVR